jgi:ATP-dependent Clp protease ATP-binding subunit ClpA
MSENLKRMGNIVGSFMEKALHVPEYEGFTKAACVSIFFAHEESAKLHLSMVTDETLFLGLISEETGIASQTLKAQGVDLKKARAMLEKMGCAGNSTLKSSEIPISPKTSKTLVEAKEEARKLFQTPTDTEHILLALMQDSSSHVSQVLANMGVDCKELRGLITGDFDLD